jgi:hypothetical protein
MSICLSLIDCLFIYITVNSKTEKKIEFRGVNGSDIVCCYPDPYPDICWNMDPYLDTFLPNMDADVVFNSDLQIRISIRIRIFLKFRYPFQWPIISFLIGLLMQIKNPTKLLETYYLLIRFALVGSMSSVVSLSPSRSSSFSSESSLDEQLFDSLLPTPEIGVTR